MTLSDLENATLLQLQESNVNFGTQPTFAQGANYSQATLDWAINRAYGKLLDDLGDVSIVTEVIKFPSVTGQYAYPVPVAQTYSSTISAVATPNATLTGITLTLIIEPASIPPGTTFTYTCTGSDGPLSALTQLVAKVNASSLVIAATPFLTPLQQELNGSAEYTVQLFSQTAFTTPLIIASSSNASALAFTATAFAWQTKQSPNIRTIRSVSYQPLGLTYNLYREPGVRLISWKEYQRATVSGYLQYFSAGQQPDYLALNTTRTKLHTYPTPYNSGDTITVDYCPQLTNSANVPASNWGYLVNASDSPPSMLPEDVQDCIWMYACFLLWPKSRELGTAQLYLKMYEDKMKQTRENYLLSTQGDEIGIRDRADLLASSFGWSNQ